MLRRARFVLPLAALALASSTALAGPLSSGERQQILGRGQDQLDARRDALTARTARSRTSAASVKLTAFKGKGAGATKMSFEGAKGRERMVLRVPGRGTGWGVQANESIAKLAAQLGHAEWVPVSIVAAPGTFAGIEGVNVDTGRKSSDDIGKVMVMEFAGKQFKDGADAPIEWIAKIPEQSRVEAAVIDLLGLSRDRKLANLMVDEHGEMRLIDHDVTFGKKWERGPHFSSAFWKGEAVSYKSEQRRFDQLPQNVRALVQAIAEEPSDRLGKVYPLDPKQLELVQSTARSIMEHGLDEAVAAVVRDSTAKGFWHADDTPNAVRMRQMR